MILNIEFSNKASKETLYVQAVAAQNMAKEYAETLNAVNELVNGFILNEKPKKFLWWTITNLSSVVALVKAIIKLIKDLKDKYEGDNTGRS